jgi:hypothetical protein
MPSDQRSHAVADPAHQGKTIGKRLHRFLIPVPKLEPHQSRPAGAREGARGGETEPGCTAFSGSMLTSPGRSSR